MLIPPRCALLFGVVVQLSGTAIDHVYALAGQVVCDACDRKMQTIVQAREIIHDCEARMARYQDAIDAGADIQEISRWINGTKAERLAAEAKLRNTSDAPSRMTRDEIAALVHRTASVTAALRGADLEDKAALYKGLNLRLTYEHMTGTIRAEAQLAECPFWDKVRVRGGT